MEHLWRVRAALVLAMLSISFAPMLAGGVIEAEAIRIFLDQSPQAHRVDAIERSVDATLRVEARIANPDVLYQVEDAAGVRDELLTVQQALPISGRRGLLKERAGVAATAASQEAEAGLLDDVYALKQLFHETLYRQQVLETLRRGGELLQRTVEILDRREQEGEGAGYDLLRAEQELAALRMTTDRADLDLRVARSRFGSFFDPELKMDAAALEGELTPVGPVPEVREATERALAQRMDLRSLSTKRKQMELESRAVRRSRFPEPIVAAGWKRSEASGLSDTGYFVGVTLPIPIFNPGRLQSVRATADAERIVLDSEIATRRVRADVQAAVAREQAARRAAERYGEEVERRASELSRIARLSYDEGESGILELMDAHRTSLTMQLRVLAARYEARVAEIDRQRVVGKQVKP